MRISDWSSDVCSSDLGYLKLSLVTCPVSLTPATTTGGKVRFHTINSATGNRVRSRYIDAETNKPVREEDEVRGYETEEGRHVVIEDEELEAVGLESTRTIDIDQFVSATSIDLVWYDTRSEEHTSELQSLMRTSY